MSLVSVASESRPNFNAQSLGVDKTLTAVVVNGSPLVTSAALFPVSAVGYGGFTILLAGVEYVVEYVTSTSALTLTTNYTGIGASVSCTFYKWCWLQIYANQSYRPSGAAYVINQGAVGSPNWFERRGASVINSLGVNYLRLPPLTLDATTNALPPTARLFFWLYRIDGSTISVLGGAENGWAIPTTTPTSYTDLTSYNSPLVPPPPNTNTYSQAELDELFGSGAAGTLVGRINPGRRLNEIIIGGGLSLDLMTRILSATASGTTTSRTITVSDALVSGDGVVKLNCAGGAITLALPSAASLTGRLFYIVKIDSTANAGTIDPNGAETINGASTFTLPRQWSAALIYGDGATWTVLAGNNLTSAGAIRTTTISTALTASDGTLEADATGGPIIVTVPAAAGIVGSIFTVIKTDSSVNLVTVDPSGSQMINGFTTWELSAQNQSVTFQSDGTSTLRRLYS